MAFVNNVNICILMKKTSNYKEEEIIELFLNCISSTSTKECISDFRKDAIAHIANLLFPSSKEEAWRYTKFEPDNIDTLLQQSKAPLNKSLSSTNLGLHDYKVDDYDIILQDGVIQHKNNAFLDSCNTKILQLESLLSNDSFTKSHDVMSFKKGIIKDIIKNSIEFNRLFITLLNTVFCTNYIIIDVQENSIIDRPLKICHLDSGAYDAQYVQWIINLGSNSNVTLYEHLIANADANTTHNHVLRVRTGNNSQIYHYKIQELPQRTYYYCATHLYLNSNSSYNSTIFNIGAKKSRNEIHADIFENSSCKINGLSLGKNTQHHDIYLNFSHKAHNSNGSQLWKYILDDKACGVFYGRINIPQDCPKTEAYQLNKTILLSHNARMFSRPELNISTDDVKCSHGSAIGSIDNDALHYLKTRGLDTYQAMNLLLEGFIVVILESIECESVKTIIREKLLSWIGMEII